MFSSRYPNLISRYPTIEIKFPGDLFFLFTNFSNSFFFFLVMQFWISRWPFFTNFISQLRRRSHDVPLTTPDFPVTMIFLRRFPGILDTADTGNFHTRLQDKIMLTHPEVPLVINVLMFSQMFFFHFKKSLKINFFVEYFCILFFPVHFLHSVRKYWIIIINYTLILHCIQYERFKCRA